MVKKIPINALQTFQLMRFATALFIGVLLAKIFDLDTAAIAFYEILLFLGSFISFFWISAGTKSLLVLFPNTASKNKAALLINIAFLMLLLGCIAGGGLYFFQDFIIQRFTHYERLEHIGLVSLFVIFNAPASLIEFIYLVQKRKERIIPYGIVIFLLQLLAIILPILFRRGMEGIFQCLLLWSMLKFGYLFFLLKKAFLEEKQRSIHIFKFSSLFNFQLQKKNSLADASAFLAHAIRWRDGIY